MDQMRDGRWEDWYDKHPGGSWVATGFAPVKLFRLQRGRNAWWETWSVESCGIHPSFKDASVKADDLRAQGSTWSIVEVPALACVAWWHYVPAVGLVVTEPVATEPFGGVTLELPATSRLDFERIAALLAAVRGHSFQMFFGHASRLTFGAGPCQQYVSGRSDESGDLVWQERPTPARFAGVLDLLSTMLRASTVDRKL